MVNRCVVGGCSCTNRDGVSTHRFPADKGVREKWDRFVRSTRKNWTHSSDKSIICGKHFVSPDDFENHMQWRMGFASNLCLKRDAIPSIRPKPNGDQPAGQASEAREPGLFKRSADHVNTEDSKRSRGAVHKLAVARVRIRVIP